MVDQSDMAEIHMQKAISTKNNQMSTIVISITAILTVLAPLFFSTTTTREAIPILTGITSAYAISCFIIIHYLGLKYEEYSGDHLMFFSVKYFENKLNTCPDIFKKDTSSILKIAKEIEDKFRLDGSEVYAELLSYYKL
jgi:hypothetical protein